MTATRPRTRASSAADDEATAVEETSSQPEGGDDAEAPAASGAKKKPNMKAGGAKAGGANKAGGPKGAGAGAGGKSKPNPGLKAKMRAKKAGAAAANKGGEDGAAGGAGKAGANKPGQKQQLVRDSFTIPKNEYHALDQLKKRAMGLQHEVRKGELLRAGLLALAGMADDTFLGALKAVPTLKPGRPKGDKAGAADEE